jgi:hypothetical protein
MQDDVIERLRDTMAGQTGGGMTCMDADDARTIIDYITALTAERNTLEKALKNILDHDGKSYRFLYEIRQLARDALKL